MSCLRLLCYSVAILGLLFSGRPVLAEDTIKLAYTDPFSGPFASGGDEFLKAFQFIIARKNAAGGALGKKFELVPFDNKSQPSDALIALKSATDQNMPFIMQCSGSNIAAALIDATNKHNERNPDNRIIYLNCGAVAPELTNEQCSFWHFRFDLHAGMKAEVMVRALPKDTTKVYLINQDYLFGQSVQREVKNYLTKLRPDVQVVGDELIPLGKIKDFSPYITKIKAAGAQALITGNWGPDMNLLIKAGVDAGADLLIAGDMGIGNTTPATTLIAALTNSEPVAVVGRGTGIDDAGWARKTAAIRDALYRARALSADPVGLLRVCGGADLAAMAGFCAQAAARRTPVLLDGVVVTAAALVADRLAPGARQWWQAGHRSTEPAHALALRQLELEPIIDMRMRLGEGTGAAVALPVVRAAVATLASMATFDEAGVTA